MSWPAGGTSHARRDRTPPGQSRRTDTPRPSWSCPLARLRRYPADASRASWVVTALHPHISCFPQHLYDGDWFDPSESISPCVDVHSITRQVHFRHPWQPVFTTEIHTRMAAWDVLARLHITDGCHVYSIIGCAWMP